MDTKKKLLDDKIALAKRMSEPRDVMPLIRLIAEDKLSEEAKKLMVKALKKSSERKGGVLLDRALSDGSITEEEWKGYLKKGVVVSDMGSLLQGYYNKKDGVITDEIVVIIAINSPIKKIKAELEKKFGIKIIDVAEGIKYMTSKNREVTGVMG